MGDQRSSNESEKEDTNQIKTKFLLILDQKLLQGSFRHKLGEFLSIFVQRNKTWNYENNSKIKNQ